MVEALEVTEVQVEKIPEEEYFEKMKVVYPRAEEDLIDFLNRCKLENKGVMLCARCSAVCDKEATAGLMKFQPVANRHGANPKQPHDKGNDILTRPSNRVQTDRRPTFLPSGSIPIERWMHQGTIKFNKGAMEVGGSSGTKLSYSEDVNKYSYKNNYKGKHPMTRTQWHRFQRQKKLAATNLQTGQYKEVARRPAKERILPPIEENKMEDDDLLDSEPDFDVIRVVSILPSEYDVQTEVTELETDFDQLEMADPKPICYYVMNNDCIEEQQATFERPDLGMKNHLKPLFIRAKVEGVGVNKVLIDGGAAVNLMPLSMLPKIGKYDCDLSAHNIVLSNYEGKTGHSRGAIQVDVDVGSIVRPTLFLVVESKANFNLLLGREWIHGVGAVPSTLHQKLMLWREDGCVENIEADQSFYMSEVDTINQQTFDKNLANIAPCYDRENAFTPSDNVIHSVKLHPTQGFIWEREEIDVASSEDEVAPPSQRLDCIYDEEPLGFEKDPLNETPKMQAQDPLEEIDIGNGSVKRPTYISANISPDLKGKLVLLLKEFGDCFAWDYNEMPGLSREMVELKLPIKAGKKPVKQLPRRFAPEIMSKIKEEIERLLKSKFIRAVRYVEWLANIVPIIKKNSTLRVCINFRDLNNATPKDEYVMPVAEMFVDSAAGFEFLSMLDGYSGYNQIFIAEEDVSKTAFRCPGALGTYEWVVMPFGLKNAGATYQRAMNSMFHDFIDTFMQVYIDDIIIKSSSEDSHLLYLRQSFERMRKHGLKMNPLKCAFCVHAGDFLGFVVHKKGIEINQNKTKAILETKPPSTKK
ncbi:hypothetical protein QL285_021373 [Trifolium repens]|nr:hypothetical protein QL285_021373 [Trifolium repens]